MAFTTGDFNMHPEVFKECDEVIDEKSNTFIALRLVQWCKNGSEPDKNLAKLELRKWRVKDGEEHADKGCSFLTPEGPGNLLKLLLNMDMEIHQIYYINYHIETISKMLSSISMIMKKIKKDSKNHLEKYLI